MTCDNLLIQHVLHQDILQGLLCAEIDNSAVKGKFFEDQGYPPASQVFSPGERGANQIGFHSFSREAAFITSNAEYQLGDPIAVYKSFDQQLTRAFGGYLVLPSPDDGGNCIELNTVAFGKSESSRCSKYINDLSADCEGKFSTERYFLNTFGKHLMIVQYLSLMILNRSSSAYHQSNKPRDPALPECLLVQTLSIKSKLMHSSIQMELCRLISTIFLRKHTGAARRPCASMR